MHFLSRLKLIKVFVFDMDGVLTDGGLLISGNQWLRHMDVRDGYALQLAVKSGLEVVVISGSSSSFVAERLKKLGVTHIFMNVKKKGDFLKDFAAKNKWPLSGLLYMGDDIPDYECMQIVGLSACPSNAVSEIKDIATYISHKPGGYGCVRDILEKALKLNGKWTVQTEITST